MRRPALALFGLSAALLLCACGKQADLEQPRPMFGKPYQPSPAQLRRDEAAARAVADAAERADPRAPQSVDEVRGQGLGRPRPLRPQSGPPDPTAPRNTAVGNVDGAAGQGPQ